MTSILEASRVPAQTGQRVVAEIADLNEAFIRLLSRLNAGQVQQALGIPAGEVQQLLALNRTARRRLTRSAVTLFDLRLQDHSFWEAVFEHRRSPLYRQVDGLNPDQVVELQTFCLAALLQLRHLAGLNRFLAGVCFCVSEPFAKAFMELRISSLRRLAVDHPGLLYSRPTVASSNWPELIRLARRIDGQQLVPARLLSYPFSTR